MKGWIDTGRSIGVPTPRDPIAGTKHVPKSTRLRRVGDEHGWSFKYRNGDYEFTKEDTVLDVVFYLGSITTGILFRDLTVRERGLTVHPERVWDVLRGAKCICPPFTDQQWEQGLDEVYVPDCAVHGAERKAG